MRHTILSAIAAAFLLASCGASSDLQQVPFSVAHRGGHIKGLIPENSVAGVISAARYGFRAIECDVHYTADSVMVLMHDGTINRTMRNASDYSEIEEPVRYRDHTYAELCEKYVLASSDPALRTTIPLFSDILDACREYDIIPMIHSDLFEAYSLAHEVLGDGFIAFDADYESVKRAREISDCLILWDPGKIPAEEAVAMLDAIGGRCGLSSMNSSLFDAEYIQKVRQAGYEVQSSIWPTPKEVQAIADGATIVLSDFSLLPVRRGYEHAYAAPAKAKTAANCVFIWNVKESDLDAGESMSQTFDRLEYGSLEVSITYTGDVELIIDGKRSYPLPEGEGMTRIGGWRFHDEAPTVEIRSSDGAKVRLSAKEYSY